MKLSAILPQEALGLAILLLVCSPPPVQGQPAEPTPAREEPAPSSPAPAAPEHARPEHAKPEQANPGQPDSTLSPVQAGGSLESPVLVDRIIAIVDQEMILQSDLDREMEINRLEQQYADEPADENEKQTRQEILQRLVESKLVIAAAKQADIHIEEDAVNQGVQDKIQELITHFGSQERLEHELLRSGMTLADYRARLAAQLSDQQYLRAVVSRFIRPKIEVLQNEIEDYYQEHLDEIPSTPDSLTLADILIPLQPSLATRQAVQGQVAVALQALQAGQPFAEVARAYSHDSAASRGGVVGTVRKGDLFDAGLENTVFSLKEGEVSQPVVTERGVHIVRVDSITAEGRAISQIFFPMEVSAQDIKQARQLVDAAHQRIVAGESFSLVATQVSGDPTSARKGGDLGTFRLEDLSSQFQEALKEAKPGDVTDPVTTPAGFYIFLVKDRKYGHRLTFPEVQDTIRRALESQKMEEELSRYVDSLRSRFFVDLKS